MSKKNTRKKVESSDESSSDGDNSESSSASSSEETSKKKKTSKKATTKKAKKKGTKRKKKDKNAPKRPLTAFMYYVKDRRKEEGEKNPELKFGDLSRAMAKRWKEMGEDEKKPYNKQAEEDKLRYEKDMKNYTPPSDSSDSSDDSSEDEKPKKKRKKQKKDPDAPKRPANPYMCYQQEIRPQMKKEFPDLKMGDLAKKMGERWKSLTESEKKPYLEKSAADKRRFEQAMEAYKNKDKEKE